MRAATATLGTFRARSITSLDPAGDSETIAELFNKALVALVNTKNGDRSPVGVGKALHTLAPDFFPIWHRKIAKGVDGFSLERHKATGEYLEFMQIMQKQ